MTGAVFITLIALLALPAAWAGPIDFFESRVRPVLLEQCAGCHGGKKQRGGLRVDSEAALLAGGESGPAVVPGNAAGSLLLKAVRHASHDLMMPPSKAGPKLTDAVIADLATWVQDGALWPGGAASAASPAKEAFDLESRKERLPWIWETPQRQVVPDGPGSSEVDRFILSRIREQGLSPAPPADPLTWLRRVHFAITGLPPRREAMLAFLNDTGPGPRERVVDGLLASPHFGERWARHWMDLMRYAESRGHEGDYLIANAWRYRDYLIRAFNSDVPYDRFTAEHLAGDLLTPRLEATTGANESVQATGWAFLGEENHSPVDIRQDESERIDNKVDVLSRTFLGLTVACARCHDHKFDAITQRDYYALSGFVLGSSYRQVRYATMVSEAGAAARLQELRERHLQPAGAALAAALRQGLPSMAVHLMEAQRRCFRETAESVPASSPLDPAKLEAWMEQVKQAVTDPVHPLHWFAMLARDPGAGEASRFQELRTQFPEAAPSLPPEARVIADYTHAGQTPWKTNGPTFGTRPLAAGELVLGTPQQPVTRIMPYGAASRDPFWNRLALTPGTETDSGKLAATRRAGRTVITPTVTLQSGHLHYLIRGKAQVYAGVDSHIMIDGPLHGGLIADFDSGGQLRWVTHDLSAYAGHRVHLEVAPQDEAALDLLLVVESPRPPAWLPVRPWQPSRETASLEATTEALQADAAAAVAALAGQGRMEPRWALLAGWLLEYPALTGYSSGAVSTAVPDYFGQLAEIAGTIRWDSPTAVAWADGTGVDGPVLMRGKPDRPGAPAPRGLPEAMGLPRITTLTTSGRYELAAQLTDPSNPLVARVMVNRVWHHLFGRGIVPTVDNFGYLGERPSHPELLDHLAWQFVHQDAWSLKRLIRRLVLTDAFARSSRTSEGPTLELDPGNQWLHRMPVRRLEGEAIRDALLVISGRFDEEMFGPPVPLPLNEFNVGRGQPGASGSLDGKGRRSLYLASRRNFLPAMMMAFDLPTPFSTVGRRQVTNVPAQSLVMMNDPLVRDQAEVWATRLLRELAGAEAPVRIQWLFETAFARRAGAEELRLSLEFLGGAAAGEPETAVWSAYCHALFNCNDLIYLK